MGMLLHERYNDILFFCADQKEFDNWCSEQKRVKGDRGSAGMVQAEQDGASADYRRRTLQLVVECHGDFNVKELESHCKISFTTWYIERVGEVNLKISRSGLQIHMYSSFQMRSQDCDSKHKQGTKRALKRTVKLSIRRFLEDNLLDSRFEVVNAEGSKLGDGNCLRILSRQDATEDKERKQDDVTDDNEKEDTWSY